MAAPAYAPYTPPLSTDMLYRPRPCTHCAGTGYRRGVTALIPYCGACSTAWQPARFDLLMEALDRGAWWTFGRNRYRWHTLPCGHRAEMLCYARATCSTCHGTGYTWLPVRPPLCPPVVPPMSPAIVYRPQSSSSRNPAVPRIRTTRPLPENQRLRGNL